MVQVHPKYQKTTTAVLDIVTKTLKNYYLTKILENYYLTKTLKKLLCDQNIGKSLDLGLYVLVCDQNITKLLYNQKHWKITVSKNYYSLYDI